MPRYHYKGYKAKYLTLRHEFGFPVRAGYIIGKVSSPKIVPETTKTKGRNIKFLEPGPIRDELYFQTHQFSDEITQQAYRYRYAESVPERANIKGVLRKRLEKLKELL